MAAFFSSGCSTGRGGHWLAVATLLAVIGLQLVPAPAAAQNPSYFDTIGMTQLQALNPAINGSGIIIAQPEADGGTDSNDNSIVNSFEVNPLAVGQENNPNIQFTYTTWTSGTGNANGVGPGTTVVGFPNTVGNPAAIESLHADDVGGVIYGIAGSQSPNIGLAPGVSAVDGYNANYFISNIIAPTAGNPNGVAIRGTVINQSFTYGSVSVPTQQAIDQIYDNYAVKHTGTLIVSAAGEPGTVAPPGTAYNSISVAAYGGNTATGPTADNGRSKPDITAPFFATSYSTAIVSGAAALMQQSATLMGSAGTDALDARTVKALLLNGATHPAGWTHTTTAPLDPNYGAGIVNVFNSYNQLEAGEHHFSSSALTGSLSGVFAAPVAVNVLSTLSGWDFNTITSSHTSDAVNNYFFNLPSGDTTFTSTLVWDRQFSTSDSFPANINNLDLYLYNTLNPTVPIALSVSTVDNVQYLYATGLGPGTYDLEVLKLGGSGVVSNTETYALAFSAVPEPASCVLLGLSALGLLLAVRRRK